MLSFTVPLAAFFAGHLLMSANLLLPSPLNKPALLLCKFSLTRIGQAMTMTFCFLLFLAAIAPLYDLWSLHQQKEATAKTITSKDRRGVEASTNLGVILTLANMVFPVINRALGLAIARAEELQAKYEPSSKTKSS